MEIRHEVTDVTVKISGTPGDSIEKAGQSFCEHVRNGAENSCILVHRKRIQNYCNGCIEYAKQKVIEKYRAK